MKKLLFLIHDLGQGGAEKVLVNLVNNMDTEKFDITVMALFGGGVNEQFLKPHIRYQTVFPRPFPGNSHIMKLLTPWQLHKLFIKEKYDIEISYLEGPSARIISGCPYENTKLVSWIHCTYQNSKDIARSFRSIKESVDCYNRFDKLIFVSDESRRAFQDNCSAKGITKVLYNTNETDKILIQKDEPVDSDFFQEDSIRLCGVGKIVELKGFDKLARIHKKLKDDGLNVHTYILGIGPDREKIENYLKENNIEDSFTFLGYQTNPYKYVSKCDLFVCSSVAEGFSTAATEALIVGTPVITTPVAGMAEMLGSDGEYGIITEMSEESLYEGIKDLIQNPEKLQHYKNQAAERGKFFSKENTIKAVEEMLLELINEKELI